MNKRQKKKFSDKLNHKRYQDFTFILGEGGTKARQITVNNGNHKVLESIPLIKIGDFEYIEEEIYKKKIEPIQSLMNMMGILSKQPVLERNSNTGFYDLIKNSLYVVNKLYVLVKEDIHEQEAEKRLLW